MPIRDSGITGTEELGSWHQSTAAHRRPTEPQSEQRTRNHVAAKLPTRRPCPSAPQHRYWSHSPTTDDAAASSSRAGVRRRQQRRDASLLVDTPPTSTTDINRTAHDTVESALQGESSGRATVPSVLASGGFVDGSTDAAGHTRTLTYASSGGAADVDDVLVSSARVAVTELPRRNTPLHFSLSTTRSSSKATNDSPPRVTCERDDDVHAPASFGGVNASLTSQTALGVRVRGEEEHSKDGACHQRIASSPEQMKVTANDGGAAAPMLLRDNAPTNEASRPVPRQLVSLPTMSDPCSNSEKGVVLEKMNNASSQMDGMTLLTPRETSCHDCNANCCDRNTDDENCAAIVTSHKHQAIGASTQAAQLATPPTLSPSALPSRGTPTPPCAPGAMDHVSSLTCLLQQHQQEGWKDELQAALKQDADAWVRHVRAEQRLLQAELSFAQAKVAELKQEVQQLRSGRVHGEVSTSPRPFTRKKSKDDVSDESDAVSEGGSSESVADPLAPDQAPPSTSSAAYQLEMETYIHALEVQTRALHDDNLQLQLRLDRRTSQLAAAQRRYAQNYAVLLHEQAVLEADYQKATEDVEEVVGMLVVARAAEQAALRRLGEYELALDDAERQLGEREATSAQPPGDEHPEDDDEVGRLVTGEEAEDVAASPLVCRHPSASSSAYHTCVDANDGDGASVTFTSAASPLLLARGSHTKWTAPRRAASSHPSPLTPPRAPRAVTSDAAAGGTPTRQTSSQPIAILPPPAPPVLPGMHTTTAMPPKSPARQSPGTFSSSSTSVSFSLSEGPSPAEVGAAASSILAAPLLLPALRPVTSTADVHGTAERLPAATATAAKAVAAAATTSSPPLPPPPPPEAVAAASTSASSSGMKSGANRLLTPFASSLAALLTPRSLRSTAAGAAASTPAATTTGGTATSPSPPLLSAAQVSFAKDAHGTPDERELLRFKCTLLELELQAKEKLYTEERDRWASSVFHAEGVHTAMGEVEARVRQVTASSNKVRGLLHEMNRLWCTSLALEDQCDSEAEAGEEEGGRASAAGLAAETVVLEETAEYAPFALRQRDSRQQQRRLRYSREASTTLWTGSLSEPMRESSPDSAYRSGSRRSPENASSGREFFGIERPAIY